MTLSNKPEVLYEDDNIVVYAPTEAEPYEPVPKPEPWFNEDGTLKDDPELVAAYERSQRAKRTWYWRKRRAAYRKEHGSYDSGIAMEPQYHLKEKKDIRGFFETPRKE